MVVHVSILDLPTCSGERLSVEASRAPLLDDSCNADLNNRHDEGDREQLAVQGLVSHSEPADV